MRISRETWETRFFLSFRRKPESRLLICCAGAKNGLNPGLRRGDAKKVQWLICAVQAGDGTVLGSSFRRTPESRLFLLDSFFPMAPFR